MGAQVDPTVGERSRTGGGGRAGRLGAVAKSRSARTEIAAHQRRRLSDAAQALWFKPSLAVVGALATGAVLSPLHVQSGSALWPIAFHGDASDARQLLVVVTGTMITVTSLVFALTVVTLQIASTQFSPRLLRTFLRDGGTQVVLGGFVGTVSYSLAGLFTVALSARRAGSGMYHQSAITMVVLDALLLGLAARDRVASLGAAEELEALRGRIAEAR